SSRRRHTSFSRDWSSDVCSSDLAYGPKLHGLARDKYDLEEIVENSLRKAGLWDEVKDRLNQPGTGLSGGQQQRLCIARTIAVSQIGRASCRESWEIAGGPSTVER